MTTVNTNHVCAKQISFDIENGHLKSVVFHGGCPGNLKAIGTLLEGEVVLQVNGQAYHLLAGQSYAINTGIPHSFSNTSARICRIISAHTPTTF